MHFDAMGRVIKDCPDISTLDNSIGNWTQQGASEVPELVAQSKKSWRGMYKLMLGNKTERPSYEILPDIMSLADEAYMHAFKTDKKRVELADVALLLTNKILPNNDDQALVQHALEMYLTKLRELVSAKCESVKADDSASQHSKDLWAQVEAKAVVFVLSGQQCHENFGPMPLPSLTFVMDTFRRLEFCKDALSEVSTV